MSKTGKILEAGLGLAALTALGTYFLYGKNGEQHRHLVRGWMLKIKGEVLEKAEEIKEINQEEYYKIVEEVTERYAKLGKVGKEELDNLAQDLKEAWRHITAELR
ncbi:MAG: hypothetical protein NDI60_02975 [Elusimicrobiales bacterium]|nr:hypothetical protein [Elusimicrobiales bacterium]